MSSTVKQLAVAGLALATGGLGLGLAATFAIQTTIFLVSAKLFAPDKPKDLSPIDDYAGQKIKNNRINTAPVNKGYGEIRQTGNIGWNASRNASHDLHSIVFLGSQVDSIVEAWQGNDKMVSLGNDLYKDTSGFRQVKFYANKPVGSIYSPTDNIGGEDTLENLFPKIDLATDTLKVSSLNDFSGLTANFAVDGNPTTAWGGEAWLGTWIKYDFTTSKIIKAITFKEAKRVFLGGFVESFVFDLYASNDDVSYDFISTTTRSLPDFFPSETYVDNVWNLPVIGTAYRYYRIDINSTGGADAGYLLSELGMYETYYDDDLIPENVSFFVARQVYDQADNYQQKSFNAVCKTATMNVLTSPTTIDGSKTYSNNPADVLLDFMTNTTEDNNNLTYSLGLNIPSSKIDLAKLWNVKQKCIDYGFTFNFEYGTTNGLKLLSEIMQSGLIKCGNYNGMYNFFIPEKDIASSITLTDDDIIEVSFSMIGADELVNKSVVSYIRPSDMWQKKEVSNQDNALITNDGDVYEKTYDYGGVTDSTQADKIGKYIFSRVRYTGTELTRSLITPLKMQITTLPHLQELELADIITLDISLLSLKTEKDFEIVSITHNQDCTINVSLIEYSPQGFKDQNEENILE